MKKHCNDFDEKMNSIILTIDNDENKKLEFESRLLFLLQVFEKEGVKIQLDPMNVKLFQYFILSILMEHENMFRKLEG